MRRVLLIAIALCACVAGWVGLFGGIQFRVGDVVLRSRDPIRPLAIAIVLSFVYGVAFRHAFIERIRRLERLIARDATLVAVICAVIVSGLSVRWSTYAASGSDSSGYVSEAYGWRYVRCRGPFRWMLRCRGHLPRPRLRRSATRPHPTARPSSQPIHRVCR